ncbi:MAG: NAD(P)-dependent oxidoreductase [Betaproteobacteria bacterium HGW-Betaproteobacteria-2]|nr:MAG: NAD(P)-dependent oxidoreductase [Betaproteobacteria bacterium HGW-Betaproteobacteria-2]
MVTPVLIVGCGDLGGAVAGLLNQQGFAVTGVRRSRAPLATGVKLVQADITDAASLQQLTTVKPKILLYCVAADAQTDESYKAHYVEGLRNVLAVLKPCKSLRHVFFVSSTRVYGRQTHDWLDEDSPAQPSDFGGQRLQDAESLLNTFDIPHTILRLSGIYGPGRTRLLQLARTPQAWPSNNSWTNRIHRDDAAAFIARCVTKADMGEGLATLYLVTDSDPVPQHEVLRWLAAKQGVDMTAVPIPAVAGGKRLSNRRMLDSGFSLRYPNYQTGYEHLLASENPFRR